MKSYNQAGQEEWVIQTLGGKRDGYFLDIGAYDGIESSNTFLLEKEFGWKGLCIESNPAFFSSLIQNRSSTNVGVAVMGYEGHCTIDGINSYPINDQGAQNAVACDTLQNLLVKHNAPKDIDYASLDIEGNELSVLEVFPFSDWNINLFTIEHNLYLVGPALNDAIFDLMTRNGYVRAVENVMCPTGPYEDWYIKG